MTVLFAGSEYESFYAPDGSPAETSNTYYDDTYVRCGIYSDGHDYLSEQFTATGDIWIHASVYHETIGDTEFTGIIGADSSGNNVVRWGEQSNNNELEYWDGSSWISVINYGTSYNDSLIDVDIHINNAVSGVIELYINDILYSSVSGDYSVIPDISYIKLAGLSTTTETNRFSQIIVADEPTIGWKLHHAHPTGNGNYTAWTGDYTDVDEVDMNISDVITSGTADQIELFTKPAISIPANREVKAVGVSASARKGTTGPQNVQLSIRFGSTDYVSANKTPEVGFAPISNLWELNPATGLEWTSADAGSATLEFGVKSIT